MAWDKMHKTTGPPTLNGKVPEWRDFHKDGISEKKAKAVVAAMLNDEIWINDNYQATVRRVVGPAWFDETEECFNGFGGIEVTWISIRRIDREPIHDWRDLQRIKNDITGPESEAMEIYPAESRLMDTANQYHLFAFPATKELSIPIGFPMRAVRNEDGRFGLNTKQRKISED